MTAVQPSAAIVTGGGSGVGRATALALSAHGTKVWVVGRDRARLERVRAEASCPGTVTLAPFDATDGAAMDRLIAEADPDLVVLSAGARARLAPVHEQTWESFSEPWNTDVKIAFQVGQTAIRRPLRAGSLVVIVSSGAGLGGSPLSGGYAGAKRMQMFLAGYLQRAAAAVKVDVRFVAVVPKQLIAGTELGAMAADAYAGLAGISREKFMERFGAPLTAETVAGIIVQLARGPVGVGVDVGRAGSNGSILGISGAGVEAL